MPLRSRARLSATARSRRNHRRRLSRHLFAARAERYLMQPTGRKAEWWAGLPRRKTRTTTAPCGRNQVRRRLAQWQGRWQRLPSAARRTPPVSRRSRRRSRPGPRHPRGRPPSPRWVARRSGGAAQSSSRTTGSTPRVRPRMPIRGGSLRSDPESRLAPAHVGSPAGAASHGVPLETPAW